MNMLSLRSATVPPQTKWQRFITRRLPNIIIGLMVLSLVVTILYPYFAITVPSGYVGVLWKRFGGFGIYCWCVVYRGTVLDPRELREEGFHIIWPWDKLYLYDLRLQTVSQTYNAITKDGVNLMATINVRFQIKHDSVAQLHKFIGPNYVEAAITPEIGSRAREIISQYTSEQTYSSARQQVENAIGQSVQTKWGQELDRLVQTQTTEQFEPQYPKSVRPDLRHSIEIIDTLLLGIELPTPVVAAINRKVEQLYVAQEYDFILERERKESERKRIEAAGIRDFQQIVSQGISDSYLRWRGIEATVQLSQSNNAKTVIIGSGKDGLPIILGNDGPPAPLDKEPHPPGPVTPPENAPGAVLAKPPDVSAIRSLPSFSRSFRPPDLSDIEAAVSGFPAGRPPPGSEVRPPSDQLPRQPAVGPQR
jgi:regulator of protease activity HflC (stomatin/prohibitin superfamily)